MTIDEAIEHAEETACGNDQCAKDHAQLADWLRELRRARMEIDLLKTLRDGFKADAQKLKAENDKLRERMEWLEDELRKQGSASAKFMKMIGVYQEDNKKLRELVKNLHKCNGSCTRCVELMGKCEYEEQLTELGIEADNE